MIPVILVNLAVLVIFYEPADSCESDHFSKTVTFVDS